METQTIPHEQLTDNYSKYDLFLYICSYGNGDERQISVFGCRDKNVVASFSFGSSSKVWVAYRSMGIKSAGFYVGTAYNATPSSDVAADMYVIPTEVYGIRLNANQRYLAPEYMEDYVVEFDTSGIWTYRKWASGFAECWGNYETTSAFTGNYAPGWESATRLEASLPSGLFVSVEPLALANMHTANGAVAGTASASLSTVGCWGYNCLQQSSAIAVLVHFHVKGRWK